ncbi:MAG: sensor histidine kinase, partial [Cyclobacteriaceae bacterium]
GDVHYEIAYTYQALSRFKIALEHAKNAVSIAENADANESLVRGYKILSDIHLARGDDRNALKFYKKYAGMMNQLYTAQIRQRQENLENQLEIEKKEKELKLLMIDKEMKDLALKELQATTAKKETDITLLKREKQLQEVSLEIKAAESEKAQQALLLSKQQFEAEKKDKEIELLQKNKSIQLLALNKKELEEKEKQKTIALLNERKALQEAELSRSKAMRSFFVGLSLLFAVILFLIYRGYREKQKANRSLAGRNIEIQKQRDRLEEALAELKAAQSQIVQSEKMASLGELTAGIAHEINNPINFVYAGVDGLRASLEGLLKVLDKYTEIDRTGSIGEIRKVLSEVEDIKRQLYYDETKDSVFSVVRAIKEGASRTAEIVKGLRSFTRLDETELKGANIHDGLDNTLILLNPKIDKSLIKVVKKYDPAIPEIECFPSQLNQVFMNILSNATEAIEGKGIIYINTYNRLDTVEVVIRDTGPGMTEEVKSKIFQPFFTTKNPGEGTGLGLSITFGIIDKHQGSIEVDSYPGEGTSFKITLHKSIAPVPVTTEV